MTTPLAAKVLANERERQFNAHPRKKKRLRDTPQIKAMIREGKPYQVIAELSRVSRSAIIMMAREMNIRRRKPYKPREPLDAIGAKCRVGEHSECIRKNCQCPCGHQIGFGA